MSPDGRNVLGRRVRIDDVHVGSVGALLLHHDEPVGIEVTSGPGERFFIPWSAFAPPEAVDDALSITSVHAILDDQVLDYYTARCLRITRDRGATTGRVGGTTH